MHGSDFWVLKLSVHTQRIEQKSRQLSFLCQHYIGIRSANRNNLFIEQHLSATTTRSATRGLITAFFYLVCLLLKDCSEALQGLEGATLVYNVIL